MFKKWKEEWLDRNELKLAKEYESALNELKATLKATVDDEEAKLISLKNSFDIKKQSLIFSQNEVEEMTSRCDHKNRELARLNEELLTQIRIAEAKLSPEGVWAQAFTAGFNKAWDMMYLQNEGFDRVKKLVREEAINSTLGQRNGNNQANNRPTTR